MNYKAYSNGIFRKELLGVDVNLIIKLIKMAATAN